MLNVSPWNLLFIVVNLLVLLALMKKFLYKPVLNIIAKRQELIDSQFAQAQASQEEAKQLKEEYEGCLADAKAQQGSILKEAKVQAGIEYDKILAEADEKAKQMIEDAKKVSLYEKEKAIKDAESEIAKLAVAAASKIVSQASDEKNDYVIYEEFLKKAGEKSETDRN